MLSPRFLDELDHRLRWHGGLERRYVRRVVSELADHYFELFDQKRREGLNESAAADEAQRGVASNPDALFDAIVCRRGRGLAGAIARFCTFARHHPFVAFVVAPLPLMIAIGYLLKFVGVLVYSLVVDQLQVSNVNPVLVLVVDQTFKACAYGVTPLLALMFCHIAERTGRSIAFAFASCVLLSMAGGMLKLDLVQCLASHHVAYFQRYGPDAARLSLPMIVFTLHSVRRLTSPRKRVTLLLAR
jgi:hypothetical protein